MAAGTLTERRAWEEHEYARKEWHYAKCEGLSRRLKRMAAETEAARALLAGELVVKPSTLSQVRDELERRAKAERALAKVDRALEAKLRALPAGDERRDAIRACLSAGITQSQLAALLDVSRQRVGQLVREAQEIPL